MNDRTHRLLYRLADIAPWAVGLLAVGGFTFAASFGTLWAFRALWGIRVDPEVETAGLDVSEHGMWGYPEFYIPVPGGYGTESHGHLGLSHAPRPAAATPRSSPQPRLPSARTRSTTRVSRPYMPAALMPMPCWPRLCFSRWNLEP